MADDTTDEQDALRALLLIEARHLTAELTTAREMVNNLAAQRRETVQQLQKLGMSRAKIAAELGMTKSAIQQLLGV